MLRGASAKFCDDSIMAVAPLSADELRVAQMLPDIELTAAGGGPAIPLRPARGETTVLVWLHAAACAGCERYLESLGSIEDEFRVWEARLIVIALSPNLPSAMPFGKLAVGRPLAAAGAGVAVADRYGQIFHVAPAGATHNLPSPRELVEWLKFLGTLCPE
jgi:hypothetical protein